MCAVLENKYVYQSHTYEFFIFFVEILFTDLCSMHFLLGADTSITPARLFDRQI